MKNTVTGVGHDFLTARLDTRIYKNGNIRTDVTMENNWTFKNNPRNIRYELTIKQNGNVVFYQPPFEHFHHARWHTVVSTAEPKIIQPRYDMQYFFDSKAVHNYDLNLTIPESILANEKTNLEAKRAEQAEF